MNFLLISIFFIAGVVQTIRKGPGSTFAYIYLPVLMLMSTVRPISIQPLPDITSPIAVSQGAMLGMLLSGRFPFFRLHLIDFMVALFSFTIAVSGYINGEFWTFVSASGNETLRWIVPYYMARLAFQDAALRRHMGLALCFISMGMGFIGMIEFRLYPVFFSRMLESMDMGTYFNSTVLGRFGFFRAMVTAEHPIDLGNIGLLLGGLIPALCVSGGVPLRDKRVLFGLGGAGLILISSMSFSSIAGSGVAVAIFLMLRFVRKSELLLIPLVIGSIAGGFYMTSELLNVNLEEIAPADSDAAFEGSYYVRVLIIQNSWNSYGQTAGWLGYGDDGLVKEELGLESVDNSYMLFLMRRGWIHLILRLLIPVIIAYLAMKMLKDARGESARAPVAALVAVLLGTMISMYTVWFGFVYAVLWTCGLAMLVTMRQVMAQRFAALKAAPEQHIPEAMMASQPAI